VDVEDDAVAPPVDMMDAEGADEVDADEVEEAPSRETYNMWSIQGR